MIKSKKRKKNRLSKKIIFTLASFIIICTVAWAIVLVNNVKQNVIDSSILEEEAYIKQVNSSVNTTIEVCSLATQIVTQSTNLMDYFQDVKNGVDYKTVDKIDFYENEVSVLEDLTNTNPYLYQLRIYVNSDTITEKMPNIYRRKRLSRLSWADEGYKEGDWKLDYSDTIFPAHAMDTTEHLAGVVTPVYDEKMDEVCVIEAATYMTCMFPELYSEFDDKWSCYIDSNDETHYTKNSKWNAYSKKIIDSCNNNKNSDIFYTSINGEDVILSSTPVDNFGGMYIHLTSLNEPFSAFHKNVYLYVIDMLFSVVVFLIIGILIIRYLMKRFYHLYGAIYKIQKGEGDVVIPEEGNDEITELAHQMNVMISNTKALHEDNMNRQLLTKNAEIKALQNQINAHFMYNALESIKMMAEIEEKFDISDAITSLGRMMRYSMKWTTGTVMVEEEVEYLKNYIALMNISYDYEIYLSLNIPDKIYQLKIPKMMLQPLVENAVYHGIENMASDTNIYIKGLIISENECTLEVSDCGNGMEEEVLDYLRRKLEKKAEDVSDNGHGIGLKNVQDRIKMCFGEEYGLEIYSELGCYTKILIRLPIS